MGISLIMSYIKFTFRITEDDYKEIKQHKCSIENAGAIGGRITYSTTQTNLGQIVIAECACGYRKDCTEYDFW